MRTILLEVVLCSALKALRTDCPSNTFVLGMVLYYQSLTFSTCCHLIQRALKESKKLSFELLSVFPFHKTLRFWLLPPKAHKQRSRKEQKPVVFPSGSNGIW